MIQPIQHDLRRRAYDGAILVYEPVRRDGAMQWQIVAVHRSKEPADV